MTLWVTDKINAEIDQWQQKLGLQHKEGLVHSMLLLAIADEDFMKRAAAVSRHLGDQGGQNLQNMGL